MLNLKNTLDGYLKNVEVRGNTVQDVNNLADIRSVGDKVEGQELYKIDVVSCGKNLFDGRLQHGTWVTGTGNLSPSTQGNICNIDHIRIKPSTTYKLWNSTNLDVWVLWYDINKNYISHSFHASTSSPANAYYMCFYLVNGANTYSIDEVKLQIEEGTQVTSYEPYQGDKLEILTPVQLEKVGDVADRIICKDGVWGIEKHIGVSTVSRDAFTLIYNISDSIIQVYASSVLPNARAGNYDKVQNINPICKSISRTNRDKITEFCCWNGGDTLAFCMFKTDFTTTLDFRNSLPATFDVHYILETPQFIPLPHDQQVKLRTFAGQTNISFLTEIEGQIKAQVPKSLGAVVNTHTQQIDMLHQALKSVLAGDMYSLATILYPEDFVQNDTIENDIMVIPE